MRKKNKEEKPPLSEKLGDDERELFLDAYYQGGFISSPKHVELPRDERVRPTDESLLDEERELFLRAINQGLGELKKLETPPFLETAPSLKRAKRRSMIDARIDLHGMFVEDAVKALLKFIASEARRGSKSLLIIHGKGSGALKQAVWSIIETHPEVADFQVSPGKLGGAGAILVRINRNVKKVL